MNSRVGGGRGLLHVTGIDVLLGLGFSFLPFGRPEPGISLVDDLLWCQHYLSVRDLAVEYIAIFEVDGPRTPTGSVI